MSIPTAGGSPLGVVLQDAANSVRAFLRTMLDARARPIDGAVVEPQDDTLPPEFVLALLAFAIVLSAIVTLVLVTSLQNG